MKMATTFRVNVYQYFKAQNFKTATQFEIFLRFRKAWNYVFMLY